MKITKLETGYDFVTLYVKTKLEAVQLGKSAYRLLLRRKFKYMDLQRKNLSHKPGDVPHFHNGFEGAEPHVHIIYPDRPTQEDIDYLQDLMKFSKDIEITEIS
jgi:hypothetical protein